MKTDMVEYYSKRADVYDDIYLRQENQTDIEKIKGSLNTIFTGKVVLEIACGTGYWTNKLTKAEHITAIDMSQEMLDIALKRGYSSHKSVRFVKANAYNPPKRVPRYNGSFACLWFSHIPKNKIHKFLQKLHSRLEKGSTVMFVDNMFQERIGGESIHGEEDSFKKRKISDTEYYKIIKNYYTRDSLEEIFSRYSNEIDIQIMPYFWSCSYRI